MKTPWTLGLLSLALVTAGPAFSDEPSQIKPQDKTAQEVPAVAPAQLAAARRAALNTDLKACRDREMADVQALQAELEQNPGAVRFQELQQLISERKQAAHLERLVIQRDHALKNGFQDLATRIEDRILRFEQVRENPAAAVENLPRSERRTRGGR